MKSDLEEQFESLKKHLVDDIDNLSCIKMWQLKKKIGIQKISVPVAKKNEKGELVKNSKLKELYVNTYRKRLEHRKMKPELTDL